MDPAAERHRVRDLLQQSDVAMLVTFGSGETRPTYDWIVPGNSKSE